MAREVTRSCRWCERVLHQHVTDRGQVHWLSKEPGYIAFCPDAPGPSRDAPLPPCRHEPDVRVEFPPLPGWPPGEALQDEAEYKLRLRNRRIADAHKQELAEHRGHQAVMGQWHEGTCKGCGLDDLPVIGVPGSEHCRYCEELRVMGTQAVVLPSTPPQVSRRKQASGLSALAAWACLWAGLLLGVDWLYLLCVLFFSVGVVLGRAD